MYSAISVESLLERNLILKVKNLYYAYFGCAIGDQNKH